METTTPFSHLRSPPLPLCSLSSTQIPMLTSCLSPAPRVPSSAATTVASSSSPPPFAKTEPPGPQPRSLGSPPTCLFFHGDHNSLLSSTLTSPAPSLPLLHPNPHANPMPLPRPSIPIFRRHLHRLLFVAATVREDLTTFTTTGRYLQIWIPSAEKASFLAIAPMPEDAVKREEFEFLVKRITGLTAEGICGMRSGDLVEIGGVMGKGF